MLSATGGQDGVVKLWRHRQDVADFDGAVLPLHQRDWDKAEICAPIPTCITLDTQRHLFTGGDDGMVRLWDMMAHRAKRRFGTGEDGVPGVSAVSVDVHEWCTQVASGTDDGAVVIWGREDEGFSGKFPGSFSHCSLTRNTWSSGPYGLCRGVQLRSGT